MRKPKTVRVVRTGGQCPIPRSIRHAMAERKAATCHRRLKRCLHLLRHHWVHDDASTKPNGIVRICIGMLDFAFSNPVHRDCIEPRDAIVARIDRHIVEARRDLARRKTAHID